MLRAVAGLLAWGSLSMSAAPVMAAPTSSEMAVAESLFREGKALMQQGNFADACPKLAESQRIDPAGGTLLTLALCYEADGKTASAWVVFGEAQAVAERDQRADRVKLSREHIAKLEKELSVLTVSVAPETAALPKLEVLRDETALHKAAFGVGVPVDPGKHRVMASAPGYKTFTVEVEVGRQSDRKTVQIPALDPIEEVRPEASPLPPSTSPVVKAPPGGGAGGRVVGGEKGGEGASEAGSGQRTAAAIIGGAGFASVVVGGVFGLQAMGKHDDALERCPRSPCSDAEGVQQNEAAKADAMVANVTIGAGLAAIAAGAVLWLTAPRAATSPRASMNSSVQGAGALRVTAVEPVIGSEGAALRLGGTF